MNESCKHQDLLPTKWFRVMWVLTAGVVAGQFAWPEAHVWLSVGLLLSWAAFCGINARRCSRMHCYFTAPAFVLGAAGILLLHYDVVRFPEFWINVLVFGALGLGCLLEMTLGAYAKRG